jgi:hypothetical protein
LVHECNNFEAKNGIIKSLYLEDTLYCDIDFIICIQQRQGLGFVSIFYFSVLILSHMANKKRVPKRVSPTFFWGRSKIQLPIKSLSNFVP